MSRTIAETVKCMKQCCLSERCETGRYACLYGEDGVLDCLERLDADLTGILEIAQGFGTIDELERLAKAWREERLVELPCKPMERFKDENGSIVVTKIVTDLAGTYVYYRYIGKRELKCCNPRFFENHFTPEAAASALNGGEQNG